MTMAVYFATLCFVGSFVALCSVRPERHSARGVMKARGVSIVVLAGSVTDNKNEESENATKRRKKLNLSKC